MSVVKTCVICMRARAVECAHVDCPNRKQVTADLPSGQTLCHTAGGNHMRNTKYHEEPQ